jgi:hypothetical protein
MTRHAPAHRPGPAPAPFDGPGQQPARGFSRVLVVAVGAIAALLFILAGVALAYFLTTNSSDAEAQAATLSVPTTGAQNGTATTSTVPIRWTAPTGYTPTGYTVLRCSGSSCTPTTISNGTCSGTITATSCTDTDTGLAQGTTYTYEIEADLGNWVSSPGSSFTAATTAVSSLTYTTQPSPGQNIQATGTGGFGVSVAIKDSNGNTITSGTGSTDSVTLAIGNNAGPGGVLSCTNPGGLTVTASGGVANFTGCDITKVGNGYTLKVSDTTHTSVPSATSNSFNITAGNVSQFAVGGLAATETAGSQVTGLTLTAEDADGNTVTSFINSHSITWSGPTTSPGGTAPTLPNGTVSFSNGVSTTPLSVTFTHSGSQTLTATDGDLAGSATTTVNAGSFAQYTVGGIGSTATAGTPVTGVTLTAADADGNPVTTYNATNQSITWSGPATSPGGKAPTLPSGTVSFSSGVSTTSLSVTFTHAGSQTLKATDGSSRTGSVTTTVNPGTASQFAFGGIGSTATAGTPVTGVTLTAEDADGNTVTTYTGSQPVTWSGPTTSPGGTAPTLPSGTVSFSSGVSTTSLSVTFTHAGSQTLTATQGSVAGSATTTVSPGAASQFAVGGIGSTATAGTPVTGVTLTAEDADGNTVTTYTGSQSITWSGPTDSPNDFKAPTLPSGTVSFSSGVSTSLSVTFVDAASQTLTAAQGSITGSATTTVSAGAAAGLSFSSVTYDSGKSTTITCSGTVGDSSFACTLAADPGDNGTITADVVLVDQYLNPVDASSQITITLGGHGAGSVSPGSVTIAKGSSASSGTFTLTLNGGGNGSASASGDGFQANLEP